MIVSASSAARHLLRDASPQPAFAYRQLTFSGNAALPALSPDGQFLAYVERIPGAMFKGSLVVQDLSGGRPRIVATDTHHIMGPAWSPDGSELLFHAGSLLGRRRPALYAMPRSGGDARLVQEFEYPSYTYSPDGTRIAVTDNVGRARLFVMPRSLGAARVDSFDLDDRYQTAYQVDWSPRGDRILFRGGIGNLEQVWVTFDLADSTFREIGALKNATAASWAPDGDGIYALLPTSRSTSNLVLQSVNENGEPAGTPRVIIAGIAGSSFSSTRQATTIAFGRASDNVSHLWLFERAADASTNMRGTQLTSGTATDWSPVFSPDGQWIAFRRDAGTTDLRVMPAAGGESRQVTFGQRIVRDAAWSYDGTRLAFAVQDASGASIPMIVSIAGGEPTRVGSRRSGHMGFPRQFAWSPDNRRLLYQTEDFRNYIVVDIGSRNERLLLDSARSQEAHGPVFSPDGRQIAIYWQPSDGPHGIWVVDAESKIPPGFQARGWIPLLWARDGSLYFEKRGAPVTILRLAIGADEPTLHMSVSPRCGNVSLAPDAKRLVCAIDEPMRSDIWIAEDTTNARKR